MPRLLTCPQCGARYQVPDSAIGAGKTVRCTACGETWTEVADAEALELRDLEEAVVDEPALVETEAPVGSVDMMPDSDTGTSFNAATALRESAYRKRRGRRIGIIRFIWLAALATLLLGVVLALMGRQRVVERFPQAADAYRALGFDISPAGVRLLPVRASFVRVDGREYLRVDGGTRNLTGRARWSPPVRLALVDAGGGELASWSVDVGSTRLGPREERGFTTEYPDPPLDASALRYGLETGGGA